MVRNIIGIDPDEGAIAISDQINTGDHILFVHRDEKTVIKDLKTRLEQLKIRVEKDTGEFKPKAAHYVSCVARSLGKNEEKKEGEFEVLKGVLGDVPLTGFYAGGEISNANLYGYTGILTLFL